MWDRVAAELDPARFALHAPDLPGHGARVRAAADHVRALRRARSRARSRALRLSPGTRWAAASRCTSRSRRPSASTRLVLVATTAGIDDADARARRRAGRAARRAVERESIEGSPTAGRHSRCSPAIRRRRGRVLASGHCPQRPVCAGRGAARHRCRRDGPALGSARRRWHPGDRSRRGLDDASTSRSARGSSDACPRRSRSWCRRRRAGLPREAPAAVAAAIAAARPVSSG